LAQSGEFAATSAVRLRRIRDGIFGFILAPGDFTNVSHNLYMSLKQLQQLVASWAGVFLNN